MIRALQFLLLAVCLYMVGCAGTIQRESAGGMKRIEGATYKTVEVVMSDAAKGMQADNPQFSAKELGDSVLHKLEAAKLLRADGKDRVEITVEAFNVRNMLTALALSFLSTPDSIDAYVRVYDDKNVQLHAYKVNASYSFGGVAGSLDSMRMAFMYEKFSDLTLAELMGQTSADNLTAGDAKARDVPAAGKPTTPP